MKVKLMDINAKLPTKAYITDLGYDLYALEETLCNPGEITKVRTGIQCEFPPYIGALIRDRSSVATKKNLLVVAGVIDPTYQGEIIVAFFNSGREFITLEAQEKIAQMILIPVTNSYVEEVTEFEQRTDRAGNGFGSSGQF
jgi:dUTP pyrophosphatase